MENNHRITLGEDQVKVIEKLSQDLNNCNKVIEALRSEDAVITVYRPVAGTGIAIGKTDRQKRFYLKDTSLEMMKCEKIYSAKMVIIEAMRKIMSEGGAE